MREPKSVQPIRRDGGVEALIAHHRETFGDATMTADPSAAAPPVVPAAPPAPPAPADPQSLVVPVSIDPRTGDPMPANPATDPSGVWSGDVTPAPGITTVPAPTATPPQPAPTQPQGQPYVEIGGQRYYTEQYLETARSQERDKMHNRLGTIEQELAAQRQEREAREQQVREEAERQAREAEAARLSTLSPDDRISEMQARMDSMQQEFTQREQQRAALDEQERRYNALSSYRARRVAEESDFIHPSLIDLVASPETGAVSEQQIEESITALKAKTDAIVGSVQEVQVQHRAAMQTVAPTGTPPVGPLDQTSGYQSLSPADIAAMDPATYAKNRPAIMEALRRRNAERGLYG
jgi:flagellar biosynthesis GTPase FlhF